MKARLKKKADQEGIPVKDLRVRSTKAKLTDGAKSIETQIADYSIEKTGIVAPR